MDDCGVRRLGEAMEGELVTVLMPVRDTPAWMLETAISSVLGQTLADFEFLIIDDGSEVQETRECLERALADPRVRMERTARIGVTRALNVGLKNARGKWIARQDADDWSEPDRLERQMTFLGAHSKVVLCGTAAWRHRQDGSRLWRARVAESHAAILAALERGNPFFHGSVVFLKSAAERIGGYREEFPCSQDYDFFWRLAEAGEAANLGEALYHYRYCAGSVSASRAQEQARAHRAAQRLARARRRGERENVAEALASSGEPALEAELKQADHLLLAGAYRAAWRRYWNALVRHPARAVAWGKAARCGVFAALPATRWLTFGRA